MGAYVTPARVPHIISNGGAYTRNRHSGDGSSTMYAGQIVKISSGVIAPALSTASAGRMNSDDIASTDQIFVLRKAVATATSDKVEVQRISMDTVFEGPILTSSTAGSSPPTAPESIIGNRYELYQNTDGTWGPDKANSATKQLVEIVDVDANFRPHIDPNIYKESGGDQMNFVRFKFIDISEAS